MRVYLPATAAHLSAPQIGPRTAYAVTPALARALPDEDEEALEASAGLCAAPVAWEAVAALLVDEPAAEADVRAARTGDEEALERAAEADLLWYDASEREPLAAELACGPDRPAR